MNNRTDVVGISLWDRLRQELKTYRFAVEMLVTAAVAFLMANAFLFGDIAPFGVAVTASSKQKNVPAAALGAILGYCFSSNPAGNMKYVGAVVLAFAIRWLVATTPALRWNAMLAPVAALVAMGIPSVAVTAVSGFYLSDALVTLSESVIAAGAAYFFTRSQGALDLGLANADKNDITCLVITFGILVIALSGLEIFDVSVGRMLALVVLLVAAYTGGETAGSIAGITAGIAVGMMGGSYGYLMGAYCLSGLVAGLFSPTGRLGTAASVTIVCAIATAVSQGGSPSAVVEAAAASVVFVLLPARWLARVSPEARKGPGVDEALFQALLEQRLQSASQALREIAETTHQVSDRLESMQASDISTVYSKVADRVCKRCGMKNKCWQIAYNDTMNCLNDGLAILKKNGVILREELAEPLAQRCCKPDEFLASLNYEYGEYIKKIGTQRKVSQVRSVVTDQFEGMALLMESVSRELGEIAGQDRKLGAKVLEYFTGKGVEPTMASCYLDRSDRMTVQVLLSPYKLARIDNQTTALDLSDLCNREFDLPQLESAGKQVALTFTEKAAYTLAWGGAQRSCGQSRLCGDCYEQLTDGRGNGYIVLSDGMGSGGAAAVDSAMTTGLLGRLIQAGVGFDAALKMVNSALLVKSGEESLATIDVTQIDLYTGRADFYKAGAAPTFVVKSGRTGYVESTSLPAGILRGVSFEKSTIGLREGDMVVMVSDGVTATGVDWIPSVIDQYRAAGVEEVCRQLVQTAFDRRMDGREDDISAAGFLLEKGV